LKDARDNKKYKIDLCHHHRSCRLVEEPIWHNYLFVRMCVVFVILRVRVFFLSCDIDQFCVQWDPYLKRASAHMVSLYLI